ncbi:hypothetical protein DYY67_1378 [Candidatus Nitrosotalea sp. TS]|nr:hypothetical protein [Candidatus Nitrosotalea sp. TS]
MTNISDPSISKVRFSKSSIWDSQKEFLGFQVADAWDGRFFLHNMQVSIAILMQTCLSNHGMHHNLQKFVKYGILDFSGFYMAVDDKITLNGIRCF